MSTYRFTSTFRNHGVDVGTVRSIIQQAGGQPSAYTLTQQDKAYLATGPSIGLSKLQGVAAKFNVEVMDWDAGRPRNGHAGALPAGVDTDYQVVISLDADTLEALTSGSFQLYGFKAVQTTLGGGAPVVWFSVPAQDLAANTAVSWTEQYQAYVSTSQIIPNGQIVANASYPIGLGQTLSVAANGIGTVAGGGPAQAISIDNTISSPYTCGISQVQNGSCNPLCAFPLYGNQMDVIAPIEKVLLMFVSQQINTGTVLERAYSQGVLIDLTADNQRSVAYDINAGWSWGGFSWAQAVAPNSDLVPLLIETVAAGFKRRALVLEV